jgi:trigger factor
MSEAPEETAERASAVEETEEEGPRVSVERTAPCECSIRIEADADYLQQRYQEELTALTAEVTLPGFRRGKAPAGLVERRLGQSLRDDLIASVVSEAYDEAVAEHDLNVVAQQEAPDLEDVDWQPGEPAEFEFRCEVTPEIQLEEDDYKGLEIEVPKLEITDDLREQQLERFAHQFASWEEVAEAGIDWDDYVEAEAGVPDAGWQESVGFHPRSEKVGPFSVEGVKGALIGARAGDEVEVDAEVAEEEIEGAPELEALAGQKVRLHLAIQNVMRQRVPEVDDELAEKIGMSSADEIHSMVEERLEGALQERRAEITEQMIRRKLLQKVDFELPPSLVERASREQQTRMLVRMLRAGVPRQEAERRAAEGSDRTRQGVTDSLKVAFLVRQIAQKETILVTESEVDSQVRAFASRQGWREERARSYLEERGFVRTLRDDMRETKVLDFLQENAKIEEVSPEEFSSRYGGEEAVAEGGVPGASADNAGEE